MKTFLLVSALFLSFASQARADVYCSKTGAGYACTDGLSCPGFGSSIACTNGVSCQTSGDSINCSNGAYCAGNASGLNCSNGAYCSKANGGDLNCNKSPFAK